MDDPTAIRQRFAHTLLSPLTVILGSLDMLLNQDDMAWPSYAKEILELAQAQAQRLHDTLDELLNSAEVKDNTVLLSWSPLASRCEETICVPGGQPAQTPETDGHEKSASK